MVFSYAGLYDKGKKLSQLSVDKSAQFNAFVFAVKGESVPPVLQAKPPIFFTKTKSKTGF
jgi:hypothetical protein